MHYKPFFPLLILAGFAFACKKEKTPDPTPTAAYISISDATIQEGNGVDTMKFRVTRSKTTAFIQEDILYEEIAGGNAIAGKDYKPSLGSFSFSNQPGDSVRIIPVVIYGDTIHGSNRTFKIQLSGAGDIRFYKNQATGTIIDDDPVVIPATGYSTPLSYPGKTLVWQDEFDGPTIGDWWTFETGNGSGGWGNHELEYYRAENASVYKGNLIIEARKESFGGFDYTSTRMVTKGKKQFKFGRIDIRAALPKGQGMWPALWMLGGNISQVGWPACGEIDIMEMLGHEPNKLYGTAHFGADGSHHQQSGNSTILSGGDDFNKQFHVFSIDWSQDSIKWYVDDVLYHEVTAASVAPTYWPFNSEQFFIFNVAVGGDWPGGPNGTTQLPQDMIVDYVRVFQ
jgi:hypothetical protein